MPDGTIAKLEVDEGALAEVQGTVEDRVAWIVERIADELYVPTPPGTPWAGRQDIIEQVAAEFQIEKRDAEKLVDLAQTELWAKDKESSSHIQRRLLMARLAVYRRLVLKTISEPRVTTTHAWLKTKKKDANGNPTFLKVPKRETTKRGADINAIRLLIDIEEVIARLQNLDEKAADEHLVAEIFARFERDKDGQVKESAGASISQKVSRAELDSLSPTAQEIVNKALDQEKRRRVKSRALNDVQ